MKFLKTIKKDEVKSQKITFISIKENQKKIKKISDILNKIWIWNFWLWNENLSKNHDKILYS